MTEQTAQTIDGGRGPDWRARALEGPEMILEDRDLMRALLAADERRMGGNVVDMRGLAMARLEARLDQVEETHRNVVAAAYENMTGTNQVHRCVLRLLDCEDLGAVLDLLAGEMSETLPVDGLTLALESRAPGAAPHPAVAPVVAGFAATYLGQAADVPPRVVTLRPCGAPEPRLYGAAAGAMRSEALMLLDLGAGRMPGLLAMGSTDPDQFRASQGTELLAFLAACLERLLRRHLE
jgi:uncharacterized protein YigA (DUF484 family)